MLLIVYRFKQLLRARSILFWALLFPIIMSTVYKVSFGDIGVESWTNIKTGLVVRKDNDSFHTFIDKLSEDTIDIITLSDEEYTDYLQNTSVDGVFIEDDDPELVIGQNGIRQSVLASMLDAYYQNIQLIDDVVEIHPESVATATTLLEADFEASSEKSLGGNSYDFKLDYYFALVAMACFFGTFVGMTLAKDGAPSNSSLAMRRSTAPISKSLMTIIDMFVGFCVHYVCIIVILLYLKYVLGVVFSNNIVGILSLTASGSLAGVGLGVVIGCLPTKPPLKIFLSTVLPLTSCFLAGAMVPGMKYTLLNTAPWLSTFNPASLLSDGFYYLVVFESHADYLNCMVRLLIISAALALIAIMQLRRSTYKYL